MLGAAVVLLAADSVAPLRAARWLADGRDPVRALTVAPAECIAAPLSPSARVGRVAFRTPLLLGGQGARAGLSCQSCHTNGHGNPDFAFPGLSGAAGTADVTHSLMSSKRGDGRFNPVPIPSLSGPRAALKVVPGSDARLRDFSHGLIVEEFDGPEPPPAVLDGLIAYMRALDPAACRSERRISAREEVEFAHEALRAADTALAAHDVATAALMLRGARAALGRLDERYAKLPHRAAIRAADRKLAAIDRLPGTSAARPRIAAWRRAAPRWTRPLLADERRSLYDPAVLAREFD